MTLTPRVRRVLKIVMFGGLFLWVTGSIGRFGLLRYNYSDSLPHGWYVRTEWRADAGDVVLWCPQKKAAKVAVERRYVKRGRCESGIEPLQKVVAGAPGDTVAVLDSGVLVNGKPWPDSAPQRTDDAGLTLPYFRSIGVPLKHGEYLLMGLHPDSFDGRYLGVAREGEIWVRLKPVGSASDALAAALGPDFSTDPE